jgi:hypothetical protein
MDRIGSREQMDKLAFDKEKEAPSIVTRKKLRFQILNNYMIH